MPFGFDLARFDQTAVRRAGSAALPRPGLKVGGVKHR
jgi:hypothetical protein